MSYDDWHPSSPFRVLRRRAELLKAIRQHFAEQDVMEVETPLLSSSATVDLFIESFATCFTSFGGDERLCYLQTSPEFPMKRLLAAGSGDIYSLAKVFRNGEAGGRHNPEFTMLEYYRVGMNLHQLMDDLSELLRKVADYNEVARFSYRTVFEEYFAFNPHTVSDKVLLETVRHHVDAHLSDLDRNDCLDLLFSAVIEPNLVLQGGAQLCGIYVYDYPATMAALARTHDNDDGERVAARFELFINGVELANGYHELVDGHEQQARFENEQLKRKEAGRPFYPYDQRLVAALKCGMPDSSGVALGVDRLMMLLIGTQSVSDVIAFDFYRA